MKTGGLRVMDWARRLVDWPGRWGDGARRRNGFPFVDLPAMFREGEILEIAGERYVVRRVTEEQVCMTRLRDSRAGYWLNRRMATVGLRNGQIQRTGRLPGMLGALGFGLVFWPALVALLRVMQ